MQHIRSINLIIWYKNSIIIELCIEETPNFKNLNLQKIQQYYSNKQQKYMKKVNSYQSNDSNDSNDSNKQQQINNNQSQDFDFYQLRSQTQCNVKEQQQALCDMKIYDDDNEFIDLEQLTLNSSPSDNTLIHKSKKIMVEQYKFKSIIILSSKQSQKLLMKVQANPQNLVPNQECVNNKNNKDQLQSLCSMIQNPNFQHKIIFKGSIYQNQFDQNDAELQSNYFHIDKNGTQNYIRRNIMLKPMNGTRIVAQRSKSKGFRPFSGSSHKRNT